MSPSEAAEIFFDLLAAAVGEEAAGFGVFVAAHAGGHIVVPAGEAVTFERLPHLARSGGAAGGEQCAGGDEVEREQPMGNHARSVAEVILRVESGNAR